jgi:1,4-dihydroxy-2-naphthoate octaprenyltransferase
LIGAVGILCGWAYTAGPFPLGYNGLGELFVLLFFGLFAVAGTHYLLTGFWNAESYWLGLCPGLLASALLAVNNVRDIETDRDAGKKTLAARFGRQFGRMEVTTLLLVPHAILLLAVLMNNYPLKLLPLFSLPFLYRPLRLVWTRTDGMSLNIALVDTAKINLIFGLLLIVDLSL